MMKEYKNKRNPLLPLDIHIPDSEAHVMPDGTLYLYGSFDEREDLYCSDRYHVVSTPDLEHWTIHDVSLTGQEVPWFNNPDAPKYPGIDWTHPTPFIKKMLENMIADGEGMKEQFEKAEEGEKPPLLFAPDCVERNGKYYLYFCMMDDSEGVAISDRPEGPFTNPIQLPCGGIDPAIFIDDDGQAYYYWGQLFSHGVKMNEDMISFDENEVVNDLVTEEEHCFHEGSSMRKIGDTYYYVYADMERGKPTSLGYSTGKSPLGPFTYQGIIIDNDHCDPESWNNHGSIECVDGQWYVFYHRCSRGTQHYRRVCAEPITINPDGTIDEVKMTSQGLGAPFAPGETMMGYQACELHGKVYIGVEERFTDSNGKCYEEKLMNLQSGDRIHFRYVKSDADWSKIRLTTTGSGKITVRMNGDAVGCITVEGTEGKLGKTEAVIKKTAGQYEVVLDVEASENLEIFDVTLK